MRRKRLIRPTNALPVGRIRRVSVASDTRTTRRKMINVQNVSKTFILHQQNGVRLPVLNRASLTVNAGECVVLHGHSGSGKSTLLRSLYANYLPDEGQIQIKHGDEWVDLVTAPARKVVEIRKTTVGWVSQFLRVIPRISALEVVMQPLLDAAFRVADDQSNRFTLPQAVKLVTKNPAQALNLQDRGLIGEGKRADLVLAHRKGNHIHIDHVWRQGKRVF
ncbi:ATP-binding cassette domain-containing protein [Escherichia coli]|uniref:ATP-binding cassette domain-containing protein n=1 Tax=Escherichia coli TaxID=562 RepID=UPI002F3E3326